MMKNLKFSKSLVNVTKISGGTAIGQVISIVTLPFITRIYGAEVLGIWATISALSNIVNNVCDLGLVNTLMLCPKKKIPWIYGLIVKIALIISCISGIIVFIYEKSLGLTKVEALQISVLVIVYSITLCMINICSVVLNRGQQYNILMANSILRFSCVAFIAIPLGLLGWKKYGYFVANILGQIITILHMIKVMPQMQYSHRILEVKLFIKENKNYVRYQMPAAVTVTLRTELPNLLIGSLFGNTMLGYYSISQKLLTIPITFLGQSLGKVFFQKIAEMKRAGMTISAFVEKNINRAMLITLIPMAILAAVGDVVVVWYFGSEYYIGGVICRIMVIRSVFNFISTSTQGLDIILDKQQYVLYTCMLQTIFSGIAILVGFYAFDNIYVAVLLMVIGFAVVQVGYFFRLYKVMNLNVLKYLKNIVFLLIAVLGGSIIIRIIFFYISGYTF